MSRVALQNSLHSEALSLVARETRTTREREKRNSRRSFLASFLSLSLSLSLGEGAGGSFKRSFFARVETIPLFWKEREREISGTDDAGGE